MLLLGNRIGKILIFTVLLIITFNGFYSRASVNSTAPIHYIPDQELVNYTGTHLENSKILSNQHNEIFVFWREAKKEYYRTVEANYVVQKFDSSGLPLTDPTIIFSDNFDYHINLDNNSNIVFVWWNRACGSCSFFGCACPSRNQCSLIFIK